MGIRSAFPSYRVRRPNPLDPPRVSCVRPPGFWTSNPAEPEKPGPLYWTACKKDDPSETVDTFPVSDILLPPYLLGNYRCVPFEKITLIIGDFSRGVDPQGADPAFTISLADAKDRFLTVDTDVDVLLRVTLAVWLNFQQNSSPRIDETDQATQDAFQDALEFFSQCEDAGELPPAGNCDSIMGFDINALRDTLIAYITNNLC